MVDGDVTGTTVYLPLVRLSETIRYYVIRLNYRIDKKKDNPKVEVNRTIFNLIT